ncbi:hypothetical protein Pcinc_011050 [Petrolisthes cinctipes]|uniref:CCHC-type domain-containing protein n=1 Tax=Petrolisthes cinctipes TaxID=88211 RepID=A0AAE1G7T8_PETCI|nr:hypothetical protein Pcinc_011050 [Petrolisthes cinctipes]
MIKPFTGEGDVVAWLTKVRLVARLMKVSDVANLIPLYLEGDALALFLEMDESAQSDADKIEARLKEAYADGTFTAFGKLVQMKWMGEQVDVFATEIRRFARLAGFKDDLEKIVKLTFVNVFPENISVALQQVPNILTMPMSEVVSHARILSAKSSSGVTAVTVGNDHRPKGGEYREGGGFKGECFRCGGPHMARYCKEPRVVICYRCDKPRHMANRCTVSTSNQGNEKRGTGAPAATPSQE